MEGGITKKDFAVFEKDIIHRIGKMRAESAEQVRDLRQERLEDIKALREERQKDMKAIMDLLYPISDTYKAASLMGKWGMAALVTISVCIGLVLSFKQLFNK